MGVATTMSKNEALKRFLELYPALALSSDKPAKAEAWVNFIDNLHREGWITDRQVRTWGNPFYG